MRYWCCAGLLLLLVFKCTGAQEMPVPIATQWIFFQKILTFERNLKRHGGEEVVIGIVYQSEYRPSFRSKDQFYAAVSEKPQAQGLSFRCVDLALEDHTDLAAAIVQHNVALLYITPLRALEVKTLAAVSRAQQRTTLTGVPEYVEAGLAVGLGMKGNKARILVNATAAKAEGANFTAQLLKVAKVYK